MKKIVSLFFLLLYTSLAFTQQEANIWYFGRNAGIDFSSGNPTALTNGQLNTLEGCSSIADENGNLLFYSDGATVWNRNHTIMQNGTGLLGDNSSSQSALIVPNPRNTNIFYLFTVDAQEGDGDGFRYSIIDMSLNGGNGDIILKNVLLVATANEKITAVIGKTCDSFWVITSDRDNFYSFEVTSSGINSTPIISPINFSIIFSTRGYIKLSPDGKKLILASSEAGSFIYDFDAASGIVSNGRELNLDNNVGYGAEFSISGNKLYIAAGSDIIIPGALANLYQFDLKNPDITAINNSRGNPFFTYSGTRGALQLALNRKIYYAVNNTTQLGVINSPESNKSAINYIHNGVSLNGRKSSQGLPPFIQSYFLPTTILNADNDIVISNGKQFFCADRDYRLKAGRIESNATYTWEKDGNIIGTDSILTINDINFGDGIYNLTVELNNPCNTTLTASADIKFEPQPTITSIPIFAKCDNDSNPSDGRTNFDLTTQEAQLTNNATNVNVDFFAQSDTNFLNPLSKTNYINQTNPETLVVRVSFNPANNANCFALGDITLSVTNSTTSNTNLTDVYICETDLNANNPDATNSLGSGEGFYDFSLKITEITTLNPTITTTTHSFNFYRTLKDANAQLNAIIAPYEDDLFTNDSEIFVRITPIPASSCFSITDFKIFVNSLPTIKNIPIFNQCDSDADPSDGRTNFDLTTQEAQLTNNATNVNVDFFTQSDTNFLNPLSKTNYINQTNPETLVVRVSFNPANNANCFALGDITLSVTNSTTSNTNLTDVYICETDLNANDPDATNSQGSGEGFYDFSLKINEITTLNPTITTNTHSINFYRTLNDANAQLNAIVAPYEDDLFTNNSDIFVRITPIPASSCFSITSFKIFVNSLPNPQGNSIPIPFCITIPKDTSPIATVALDASTGTISDTYQWYKNGQLITNATNAVYLASDEGIYKVAAYSTNTLLENSCVGYNTFTVTTSSKAFIVNIDTTDDTLNDNSITITLTGEGDYEYALNDSNNFIGGINNFSHTFSNLEVGIYTIQIRDKNGCGITYSDEIPIIFFQKHCTPNEDGIFDTWKILGVDNDFFQSVTVNIYDRYGKRVAVIPSKDHQGWGGIYNGKKLPSTDYWYDAMLLDKNGKIRRKKSHFSLLRK